MEIERDPVLVFIDLGRLFQLNEDACLWVCDSIGITVENEQEAIEISPSLSVDIAVYGRKFVLRTDDTIDMYNLDSDEWDYELEELMKDHTYNPIRAHQEGYEGLRDPSDVHSYD